MGAEDHPGAEIVGYLSGHGPLWYGASIGFVILILCFPLAIVRNYIINYRLN